MKTRFFSFIAALGISTSLFFGVADEGSKIPEVEWDANSLIVDGERVTPVMGEIHYSRVPEDEWRSSIKKMKDGGVTIIG